MPLKIPQAAGKSYRPANGTEGEIFMGQYCYQCRLYDECEIWMDTMLYNKECPDYPKEWVFDKEGVPTCTAFVKEDEK